MEELKVSVRIDGVQPTLMHNSQTCNPLNKYAKAMKAITSKRKKSDEDLETLSKIEWEAGLYFSESLGPYYPSENVEGMLRTAAASLRQGKAVTQSVRVYPLQIPLQYTGPRDLEGLRQIAFAGDKVDGEDFYDMRTVKNPSTGSRVMRTRPRFNRWSLEFTIVADDKVFNIDDIIHILSIAGSKIGLSDYRPRYGLFEYKILSDNTPKI